MPYRLVAAGAPVFRIRRLRYFELCSVAVSAGIARRMRRVAWNVSVGRERPIRQESRRMECRTLAHLGLEADQSSIGSTQLDSILLRFVGMRWCWPSCTQRMIVCALS